MQKIKGRISSIIPKISGCVESNIRNISGDVKTSPSQYYYTKPEIDEFRREDRQYVNDQVIFLQEGIDSSGHKLASSFVEDLLIISLLDKNNNIISTTSEHISNEGKYVVSGEYDSQTQSLIFYYNDENSFSVSLLGLIESLPSKQDVQDVQTSLNLEEERALLAEGGLSNRITNIENDYLTSSDKSDLQLEISGEKTARENADSLLSEKISNIENGFTSQDINTSSITVQYTKSLSKITLISNNNNWSEIQLPTDKFQYSGTYGNNYFVSCGNNGTICYSDNGSNWTLFSSIFTENTLNKICYGNGYFLAISYETGRIYKSFVPTMWNIGNVIEDISITNLLYINNKFFITGENGKIGFSINGEKFKIIDLNTNETINSIAYGNGCYIAVGSGGFISYSRDSEDWNNISDNLFTEDYKNIIYNNGLFLTHTDNTLKYSYNYFNFNIINIEIHNDYFIKDITYTGSKYYLLLSNNILSDIYDSISGIDYSFKDTLNGNLISLFNNNNNFIFSIGSLLYGLDFGIDWSYDKPSLQDDEYLWGRSINCLNNGEILYSAAYYIFTPKTLSEFQNDMGFIDNSVDDLLNYYDKPTTNDLLDEKQDDMSEITDNEINNLFN